MCEQAGHIGSRVGRGFEQEGQLVGREENVRLDLDVIRAACCVLTSDLSRTKDILVESKLQFKRHSFLSSCDVTCVALLLSFTLSSTAVYPSPRMSRQATTSQQTLSAFPSLPSTSLEPVPEAQQHLAARKRKITSLRPHRLSVSSALSRASDVSGQAHSKVKRRKGIDLDVGAEPEPDPECVMRVESASPSAVHVADRRRSQDDESRDVYEWALLYENQRG
jgi:hypothetical protein